MKRLLSIILAILMLLSSAAAYADGFKTLSGTFDRKKHSLKIGEYGYGADQTEYIVTVDGYNVLLSGKSGNLKDLMPFRIAIAWDRNDYLTSDSFALTTEPVTTAYFRKPDGSPIDEPLYIIIAVSGSSMTSGFYYVIAEDLFYPANELFPPVPKAEEPAAIELITPPADCQVEENGTASFTVEASGAVSYQWQYSYNNGKSWSAQNDGGKNTIQVEAKAFRSKYLFRCVLRDEKGRPLITEPVKIILLPSSGNER